MVHLPRHHRPAITLPDPRPHARQEACEQRTEAAGLPQVPALPSRTRRLRPALRLAAGSIHQLPGRARLRTRWQLRHAPRAAADLRPEQQATHVRWKQRTDADGRIQDRPHADRRRARPPTWRRLCAASWTAARTEIIHCDERR